LPPLNDPDLFNAIDYQPFIFAGGRINQSKRQHLLVEAMRYVKADVKLVIVGPPDTESDAQQLRGLVERYHLENRVTVRACFVSRKLIGRLVSRARACAYLPVDEDSLGYVTMEACEAAKPVLTTTDAGGVLELVRHRETGWVADPSPEAIAAGIDMLGSVRHTAERLGRSAHALLHSLNLTWPYTIERLLS
jgi:glycosyltransferase involved in cell wall biosynthesis